MLLPIGGGVPPRDLVLGGPAGAAGTAGTTIGLYIDLRTLGVVLRSLLNQ